MAGFRRGQVLVRTIADNRSAAKAAYELSAEGLLLRCALPVTESLCLRANGKRTPGRRNENGFFFAVDCLGGWLLESGQPVYWFSLQKGFDPQWQEPVPEPIPSPQTGSIPLPQQAQDPEPVQPEVIPIETPGRSIYVLEKEELLKRRESTNPFTGSVMGKFIEIPLNPGSRGEQSLFLAQLNIDKKRLFVLALPVNGPWFSRPPESMILPGRDGKNYCVTYEEATQR